MRQARILIVIGGILLPLAAGIVNSSLPMSWGGMLFLSAFHAICWVSVLLATLGYRHAVSAAYPALFGFAWPTLYYLTFDSRSSAIGLVFLPIENLVLVFIGWLVGRHFDREMSLE